MPQYTFKVTRTISIVLGDYGPDTESIAKRQALRFPGEVPLDDGEYALELQAEVCESLTQRFPEGKREVQAGQHKYLVHWIYIKGLYHIVGITRDDGAIVTHYKWVRNAVQFYMDTWDPPK